MKKTLSDKELSKQLKNVYVQKMMEERGYNVLLDGDGNIKLPYLEAESLLAEENKSLNRFSWGGFFLPTIYLLYVGKTGLFTVFFLINTFIIYSNRIGLFGDNEEIIRIIAFLIMGIRVGICGKRRFREKTKRNFENFIKSHKLEDITFIDNFKEFSKVYKKTNITFIIIGILLEIIFLYYSYEILML